MSSDALVRDPKIDITLFVACYNEEVDIIPTLNTVMAALDLCKLAGEIIVIDDASTDKSVPLIRGFIEAHQDFPITLYVNEVNQGLGANFAEGAFRGRGKYYRLICGDNVESKARLASIFQHIGEADMIIPYPVDSTARPKGRQIISGMFTRLVNLIGGFKVRYYNGLAVHLRYNVMRWHSNAHGFGFQADLITRLLDMNSTYVEVPVTQEDRTAGESKALTLRNVCSVGHSLLEIGVRRVGKVLYPQARRKPLATLHVYGFNAPPGTDTISNTAAVNDVFPL